MSQNEFENPFKSTVLFGLKDNFNALINLYKSKTFPKVLMLTGKKGLGKFTLINHFLNYVFNDDYDLKNNTFNISSSFYKQYLNNIYPNIIYLQGSSFKNIKIDNIRNLKKSILKSSLLNRDRFIILDDVELFNENSLNALLKMIEEPGLNQYFILINNKMSPLIDTIHSRSIEIKYSLSKIESFNIINLLIKKFNLKVYLDSNLYNLTPGNYLLFNKICGDNKIDVKNNFIENLDILLNQYKKNKNINFINMILFIADIYLTNLKIINKINIENIIENRNYIAKNLNMFIKFNMNQKSLINAISNKLLHG